MKTNSNALGVGANLIIAVLTTLLMLGVLEIFVRAFIPVRNVGPAFTVYDPIYGKRLIANFHATRITPEFRFKFDTNSLGMRDPEPTKPVSGGIVFIGDSFTMGYGVQDNEAYPAVIRASLKGLGLTIPVLNTGMGNNGNGRWVKFFDHDAARFRPRIVVFQVMANDFEDNLAEHLFKLDGNDGLREIPIGPPGFARKAQTIIDSIPGLSYSYLVGLAWMAVQGIESYQRSGRARSEPSADSDKLTYMLVGTSVDKALAMGADVIGLLVGLTGQRRQKMREIFRERGLPCIDGPIKKDLFYKVDGHWNAAGHRRAAEILLPEIIHLIDRPKNVSKQLPRHHDLGHM
jgi:hypothetical protein